MFRTAFSTAREFRTAWMRRWCDTFDLPDRMHRKHWEYAVVAETLDSHGLLSKGRSAIGFGVGSDRSVTTFADCGVQVLATDLLGEDWQETHQQFRSFDGRPEIETRIVDMNSLSESSLDGKFDFCWSLCSMDHVGSIWLVKRFLLNSLNCLNPGGISVHTGEYTIRTDMPTSGTTVWLTVNDILDLERLAAKLGIEMAPVDWFFGDSIEDHVIDCHPYENYVHLKVDSYGGWGTSIVVAFKKNRTGEFWIPIDESEARRMIDEFAAETQRSDYAVP